MAATLLLNLPRLPTWQLKNQQFRFAGDRQELFNRIAPVYDNHRIWKRMAVSWTEWVSVHDYFLVSSMLVCISPGFFFMRAKCRARPGNCVLDLCCGSGDLAFLLSQKVGPHGKVIGLDFSKEQLLISSSRQNSLANACYKNIEWIEGDALDLPFADGYFDAITMGYGLRNVVDRYQCMLEIFRVLRPGSRVSILDFNKSTEPFTASFQGWMIDNVVVPAAAAYGLEKEYNYLKSSINEFLTGRELEKLALDAGFSGARHYEISGGLMGNLVATR